MTRRGRLDTACLCPRGHLRRPARGLRARRPREEVTPRLAHRPALHSSACHKERTASQMHSYMQTLAYYQLGAVHQAASFRGKRVAGWGRRLLPAAMHEGILVCPHRLMEGTRTRVRKDVCVESGLARGSHRATILAGLRSLAPVSAGRGLTHSKRADPERGPLPWPPALVSRHSPAGAVNIPCGQI